MNITRILTESIKAAMILVIAAISLSSLAEGAQPQVKKGNSFDASRVSNTTARTSNATLSYIIDDPLVAFENRSLIKDFINRHLFVNDRFDNMGLNENTANSEVFGYTDDYDMPSSLGQMSLNERRMRELVARDQAYRVVSNMVLSIDFVAHIKDTIEPYTRPVEVYEGADGKMITNYFGASDRFSKNRKKVFAMSLGISPSHTLNFMADIFDFQFSLLDGNRVLAQYKMEGGDKVGFESQEGSKLLFKYSFGF